MILLGIFYNYTILDLKYNLFSLETGGVILACWPEMWFTRGSSPGHVKPKTIKFVFKYAALRSKNKEWLGQYLDVYELRGCCFSQLGPAKGGHHRHLIARGLFSPRYSRYISLGVKRQSLTIIIGDFDETSV